MKKDPKIFLEHILESIGYIEEYLKDKGKRDFLKSVQLQDCVIRRLEVIGEAVKNLPREFKNKYPHIPWKEIAGTRDILIHHYFGVDLNLTWEIATKRLKKLKRDILKIKKALEVKDKHKDVLEKEKKK